MFGALFCLKIKECRMLAQNKLPFVSQTIFDKKDNIEKLSKLMTPKKEKRDFSIKKFPNNITYKIETRNIADRRAFFKNDDQAQVKYLQQSTTITSRNRSLINNFCSKSCFSSKHRIRK